MNAYLGLWFVAQLSVRRASFKFSYFVDGLAGGLVGQERPHHAQVPLLSSSPQRRAARLRYAAYENTIRRVAQYGLWPNASGIAIERDAKQ